MLGEILRHLTDPAAAAAVLAVVGDTVMRDRITRAAAAADVSIGELVATKVRHLIDHGQEDVWLDLIGVMSDAAQPGAVAIDRILARAFPDPVRVRIARAAR